ncbi:hypothetical protein KC19_1G290300 [Ceratodon purpureus]|uniref:Uncharacterized protein n=1 Tax=Ceratodon purpureus TaxID=3225 RepID=A0A8T0JDF4_CERPU|nr:hypothetical protein KC19_1G290300 [Ceratodon purpureus]
MAVDGWRVFQLYGLESVRRCVHFTSFGTIRRECIFEAGRSDTLI